ncbi:MAG TPA: HdeD family acid-resistance protein [Verrucomicrobiae bacterium]|nr:HdeD family acid-resistance protein [Verrucomicrobiae bacterium]HTZ54712.1 HdeD family acid-resistance protein [Candidatus Acidoferrum sp.]
MVEAVKSNFRDITGKWWLLLLRGLAAVVVGVIAFVYPGDALTALVLVLGIYAFVAGVLALWAAAAGIGGDYGWALFLEGIIAIIAALLIWSWPLASALAFVYFVAAWLIVSGILQITAGVRLRDIINNEWLYILSGVVSIVFGVWVFRNGSQGVVAVAYLIGWYFLLYGLLQIGVSFRVRSMHTAATS